MEQLVRNKQPPEVESGGFPPASDIDTGVIPIRTSGRGMLQVAVDETRRTAALKAPIKARAEALNFYYGQFKALKNLNIEIREKQVTALIGPSGCGKSTFLRCFNRMHDLTPGHALRGPHHAAARGDQPGGAQHRSDRSAHAHRHGVSEAEPISEVDLRERRLRAAHPRRALADPHPGRGREGAARSRAVGRGQGPARELGAVALRRPAAAAVHRARARDQP